MQQFMHHATVYKKYRKVISIMNYSYYSQCIILECTGLKDLSGSVFYFYVKYKNEPI